MENKISSSFGKNIVKYRKVLGLSQQDIANKTNISKRMIAYYETQAINIPMENIKKIANALNVSMSDLLEDKKYLNEIVNINPRFLKIIMRLKNLPKKDKDIVYSLINSLNYKNKMEKSLRQQKQLTETES